MANRAQKEIFEFENIGPIKKAKIELGDLTIFVGPQSSGKTIALELIHLLFEENYKYISNSIKKSSMFYDKDVFSFLDKYLGENMSSIYNKENSSIKKNGKLVTLENLVINKSYKTGSEKTSNFIPAQRVLMFNRAGGLKVPDDFNNQDPFVLTDFTQEIREYLSEKNPNVKKLLNEDRIKLFPNKGSRIFISEIEDKIANSLFKEYSIYLEKTDKLSTRLVLNSENKKSIPFLSWSAGQREFAPLLLALIKLHSARKAKDYNLLIVEELEMGLHPDGVMNALLLILYTIHRGYKVILSSHSYHLLEFIWYLNQLKDSKLKSKKLELANIFLGENDHSQIVLNAFEKILKMDYKVYFFDKEDNEVKDITTLDSLHSNPAIAEWGGFNQYSKRMNNSYEKLYES
ncbi:MAG: AAA family ATPase [Leptospiraceae bacterium]|nr:AAA family ATPase [Leptospiraceae bacterium]